MIIFVITDEERLPQKSTAWEVQQFKWERCLVRSDCGTNLAGT